MNELAPVAPPERVAALDVLRGGALLGVLVSNVYSIFSGHRFAAVDQPDSGTLDFVAARLIELLIAGKAITLLACLFGLGFSIQLIRADQRGVDVRGVFARRLVVLLAIGAGHCLLWWGDVTWTYAVTGFALFAFARSSPRALLGWAIGLAFVPQLVMVIPEIAGTVQQAVPHPADRAAFERELIDTVRGTDYLAIATTHLRHAVYHSAHIGAWYFPWVVARFLIGHYAGTRRLFDRDGADHLPLFRRVLGWGLAIGVPSSAALVAVFAVFGDHEPLLPGLLAIFATSELSILALALAYAAATVLVMQRPGWRRLLMVLAPAGRMPLTSYLGQSVIATFIFYGWGLGLVGRLGAAACVGLSLVVFAVQTAACQLWLRRYRFGPAEWLWRSLAYRRRQPMRS